MRNRKFTGFVLAAAVAGICGLSAHAQTWSSGGGDNNWGTGLNWAGGAAPKNDGTANLFFGTGARTSPNVNTAWNVNSITFNSGSPAFMIGGNAITLGAGGITNNSSSIDTLTSQLVIGASQTWNSGTGLTVNSMVNLGSSANTLTVSGGVQFQQVVSGNGSLVKNGGGNLFLGNGAGDNTPNTFTGTVTVNSGTLTLNKADSVAALAGDLVINGGILTTTNGGQFGANTNLTLAGGTLNVSPGSVNTLSSMTFLSGGITSVSTYNLSSSGTGSLTLGAGIGFAQHFNLTSATGGGVTLVNDGVLPSTLGGTLNLGGAVRTFNVADVYFADDLTVTSVISNGGITKTGAGTLDLGGGPGDTNANTYSGLTTVNAGLLFLDKAVGSVAVSGDLKLTGTGSVQLDSAGQLASTSNVTLSGGSFSAFAGATFGSLTYLSGTGTFGTFTLTSGGAAFTLGTGVNSASPLIFANPTGGNLVLIDNPGPAATQSGNVDFGGRNRVITTPDNGPGDDLIVSGAISNGGVTKGGQGTLALLGHNTYTGDSIINGGILRISADDGPGVGGTVTINPNGTLQTSGNFTLTHPVVSNSGNFSVDLNAKVTVDAISGAGLFKVGPGTLVLSNANPGLQGSFDLAGTIGIGDDGALGSGALTMADSTLNGNGALRTLANPLFLTGALMFGGADLTFTGVASAVTNNPTLFINGGTTVTFYNDLTSFQGAYSIIKDGPGTMILAGGQVSDPLAVVGGQLILDGATVNTSVVNRATLTFDSGTISGAITNFGSFAINQSLIAPQGLTNFGTLAANNSVLTFNAAGLDNEGTTNLNGGGVQGAAFINNGQLTGNGAVSGTMNFTNNGLIAPTGAITLNSLGTLTNSGQIQIGVADQLSLTGSNLQNSGTLTLAGGQLTGSSQFTNNPGGIITGNGTISAKINNAGGSIVVTSGTLNVSQSFNNSGVIQMGGITASLIGGAITNTGTIQGVGSVSNVVANNAAGTIEAAGGTLTLAGSGSTSTGLIASSSGNKVLFAKGLGINAGTISLTGGIVDNNGNALTNAGQISGYGTLRTGGLTNNGSMTFSGGTSTINGNVTNAAGHKVEVRFSPAIFSGNFVNNGTFKSTGANVTFAGTYTENGTFNSDPADNFFNQLTVGANGALLGAQGDHFYVSGDLLNASASPAAWNTRDAALHFAGSPAHVLSTPGIDRGANFDGYDQNFAWGSLELAAGESLSLKGAGAATRSALYVGDLLLDGGFQQLNLLSTADANLTLYYDPTHSANTYLGDGTYTLNGGGTLAPVPEPTSLGLIAAACGAVLLRRRKENAGK